jgi:alpha/beta superfamily hydrolase
MARAAGPGSVRAEDEGMMAGAAAAMAGDRSGAPMTRGFPAMLAAMLAIAPAIAQPDIDYAREERWAQEVAPSIVVGDAVWLVTPTRAKVLAILTVPPGTPKGGVIIIHGLGVHPDFGMIGGLRAHLADAGFVTLSVQMPVLGTGASRADYAVTLAAAAERIAAAIDFLHARRIARVALVSHSVGATMANAYIARTDAARVDAWVPIGMLVDFASPPKEPVQDVLAENELIEVAAAASLRAKRLPRDGCSRQVVIAGADHYFETRAKELSATIAAFLDRVFSGRCAASAPPA